MERDLKLFPQDNIGDALWQMSQQGDDLSIPREIQFSVLFASEQQALKYGQLLLENNQKLSFCPYPDDKDYPWEITAYPEVEASYENIAAYQELLENSAQPFQGKYDGWYCVKKGE
ncbi:ribonuclease E inhibitor RraB [Thalassomonas sp. RHCl1]|uniref:ribonuclease E inhibitor RraB n=1 Tax=Thalassomonas sp. RHCl1 TaxID=2995320 RepID=UPI00248D1C61|nr:ribonuclease E inhibitor RraB [Thalassomonas sp. RHCl1]